MSRNGDAERTTTEGAPVDREALDAVREADRRIGERLETATASRTTVEAARADADRILARARNLAQERATAASKGVAADTKRIVADLDATARQQGGSCAS